jgi:hypothetical protein
MLEKMKDTFSMVVREVSKVLAEITHHFKIMKFISTVELQVLSLLQYQSSTKTMLPEKLSLLSTLESKPFTVEGLTFLFNSLC